MVYRVFISYSHGDRRLVERIAAILEEDGLRPMWDKDFVSGHGFHEQIRNFIAHSHVLLPVITPTADERKWVHQEIGYAMALNIPVLPIAVAGSGGREYRQTVFTRHAPTIGQKIRDFEAEFHQLLDEANIAPEDSYRHAMAVIEEHLTEIPATAEEAPWLD